MPKLQRYFDLSEPTIFTIFKGTDAIFSTLLFSLLYSQSHIRFAWKRDWFFASECSLDGRNGHIPCINDFDFVLAGGGQGQGGNFGLMDAEVNQVIIITFFASGVDVPFP